MKITFAAVAATMGLAATLKAVPLGEGEGYVLRIDTEETLLRFSSPESLLPGVERSLKYLVPVRDGDGELLPTLFQNVNHYSFHFDFLKGEFPDQFPGGIFTTEEYSRIVERRAGRQYFAGVIYRFGGAVPSYGFNIFTLQGAATAEELPRLEEARWVYEHLAEKFSLPGLAYAPFTPDAIQSAEAWVDPGFPVSFAFGGGLPDYLPYTRAENFGRVKVLTEAEFTALNESGAISFQDILVLGKAPRDIEGVIAGVITGSLQAQLDHLALRTARRGTPNAYVREAPTELEPWDGELVHLKVEATRYSVVPATLEEAEAWWEAHRPDLGDIPDVDGEHSALDAVADVDLGDTSLLIRRYGGKGGNFARLQALLPAESRVPGFLVPFHYYIQYLEGNRVQSRAHIGLRVTFGEYIHELLDDPLFQSDSQVRFKELEKLRGLIEDGEVDAAVVSAVGAKVVEVFGGADLPVRFRSSSNVEDLLEFNGAGLYSSTSGCVADDRDGNTSGPSLCDPLEPKERGVARALKKVWASLWNFRAFEEREYYRIPHRNARMAVLVSEAFPDEAANGVAFTGNPDVIGDRRFLVNVQYRDTPVVFPEPGVLPEKNILELEGGVVKRILRSTPSTLVPPGEHVLSDEQLRQLGAVMASVESRFEVSLGGHSPEEVLLDFEFKFDREGRLRFKQMRPFLISTAPSESPDFRLIVPPGTTMCGAFKERRPARQILEKKLVLGLREGVQILRSDGTGVGDIFEWIDAGPVGPRLDALGPGVWEAALLDRAGLGLGYSFRLHQDFDWSGEPVRVVMNLFLLVDGPQEVILDPQALTLVINPYFLHTEADFGVQPDIAESLPFLPCDVSHLPLHTVDAELETGDTVHIDERFQLLEEGTGPAEIASGEVSIAGETQFVRDYWRLVYTAAHHNDPPREHWVVLDPPIEAPGSGTVRAVSVFQGEAPGDSRVTFLGEDFEPLATPAVTSFVRRIEGANPLVFRRGDADFSGRVDLSDALFILRVLFFGTGQIFLCQDAADVDDLGDVDITDPILILEFLFLGSSPPAPPGPFECGEDDLPDELPVCIGPGCD